MLLAWHDASICLHMCFLLTFCFAFQIILLILNTHTHKQIKGLFSISCYSWNYHALIFVKGVSKNEAWSFKSLSYHQIDYFITSTFWKFKPDWKPPVDIQKRGYWMQSMTKGTRPFRCLDVIKILVWPHIEFWHFFLSHILLISSLEKRLRYSTYTIVYILFLKKSSLHHKQCALDCMLTDYLHGYFAFHILSFCCFSKSKCKSC